MGLMSYSLQFTVRIPSQQSIVLAPDPLKWGLTFYNSQCESRVSNPLHSHRIYLGFKTYGLYFTVRISSQQCIVLAQDLLKWGLTIYNSQCESRVSNLLHSHRIYLGFRTYPLQFTVRIPSQQSIVLAP